MLLCVVSKVKWFFCIAFFLGNRGKATSFFDATQDSAIAGDLARILKQANQPVPEWLGRGGGTYMGDSFGGVDVRGVSASELTGCSELKHDLINRATSVILRVSSMSHWRNGRVKNSRSVLYICYLS